MQTCHNTIYLFIRSFYPFLKDLQSNLSLVPGLRSLHRLAAYLLNGLQRCSSLQAKMEAASARTTQNNKIKHTFAIYRLLSLPSCKHAHSRDAAANFSSTLICFIKRFTQEGVTWHFAAANRWIVPSCWVANAALVSHWLHPLFVAQFSWLTLCNSNSFKSL